MTEKRYSILCVDDEKSILNALKRLLRKEGYQLFFADSGAEGLEALKEHEVQMVISDQRMPQMNGTEFLAEVKSLYPDVLRIILTGYSDVESITQSINQGHIYKFFFKPWNDERLVVEIRQALKQLDLAETNRRLDETIIKQNLALQEMNEKLEQLVKERTREIELQNNMLQLSHAILEDLPISVMGIDNEGTIVLTNRMAQDMICRQGVKLGALVNDYFSQAVPDAVRQVIDSGQPVNVNSQTLRCIDVKAVIMPLSGHYKGRGVIMTINPMET
jgi:response regulator RpfG family c-di-GMP phosphodiesterase